jgi:hypothetical protein
MRRPIIKLKLSSISGKKKDYFVEAVGAVLTSTRITTITRLTIPTSQSFLPRLTNYNIKQQSVTFDTR